MNQLSRLTVSLPGLTVSLPGLTVSLPRLTLSLLATVLITGCASQATLRIHSEPQGAYISDNSGRLLGTTPLDINYPLNGDSSSCVETDNFTAHWVSGVEAEVRPIVLCEAGYTSTLITRDFSQPGLAEDREFALQLEMLQLQQEQTRAAQDAADASWAAAAAARDAAYEARSARYRQYRDRGRDYRDNDGDRDRDSSGSNPPVTGTAEQPATQPDAQPSAADVEDARLRAEAIVQVFDVNEQARLMAEYQPEPAAVEVARAQEAAPAPVEQERQEAPAAEPSVAEAPAEPQAEESQDNTGE